MPKLPRDKLDNVKNLLMKKLSQREISKLTNIPKTTIHRLAKKMNLKSGGVRGRKQKLSAHDVTYCVTQICSNQAKTAQALVKTLEHDKGIKVHRSTIANALRKAGMKATTKKKKPAISEKNRKERLAFAKSHKDWTVEDWKTVIFSDETKINRFGSDGLRWSWVREGESLQPRNIVQTTKHGGGHIMIWGCFKSSGIGYMCDKEDTMDQHLHKEILENELADTIEYYELEPEKLTFQHDNDPKHTAKSVKDYLRNQEYQVMVWPAQSPDLNPIENCWSYLKNKIYSYETPANGLKELFSRVETEWEKISIEYLQSLYESMPRRMLQVIKANGRWTKY